MLLILLLLAPSGMSLLFFWMLASEASCVSQIQTAAAVETDMGKSKAISKGVSEWARCGVTHSERDVHRTIKKQKTKLDIPIRTILCNGAKIPWISPASWLRFLVDKGLWPVLAGCGLHDYDGACQNWLEFWQLYRKVHPTFGLFDRDDVDLSRTAAIVLHGDEGRTLKKGAMLVTSLQSALGRGYDQKRVNHAGTSRDLKVNFAGHSFTTRWIVHTIPKSAYDGNPELFNSAMEHTAKSCRKLLEQGYVDVARGHETFRVVILGVKGDAPYLSKVGRFYRAYNTTAKRGEERGAPK